VEVAVVGLADQRGLRAALRDVDAIFHLASAESQGSSGSLLETDVRGTANLVAAAEDAGLQRFFYLSHIGAERASAYPPSEPRDWGDHVLRGVPHDLRGPRLRAWGSLRNALRGLAPLLAGFSPFSQALLLAVPVEDPVTTMVWASEPEHHQ
jgi:NADH dehydrogenase